MLPRLLLLLLRPPRLELDLLEHDNRAAREPIDGRGRDELERVRRRGPRRLGGALGTRAGRRAALGVVLQAPADVNNTVLNR